jgi:hypothetical protein
VTLPTGAAEPGNTNALAQLKRIDPASKLYNAPHNLVTWNDGQLRIGQLAVDDVQISSADATGFNPD